MRHLVLNILPSLGENSESLWHPNYKQLYPSLTWRVEEALLLEGEAAQGVVSLQALRLGPRLLLETDPGISPSHVPAGRISIPVAQGLELLL